MRRRHGNLWFWNVRPVATLPCKGLLIDGSQDAVAADLPADVFVVEDRRDKTGRAQAAADVP